jgi:PleD family two-component response regulator
LSTQPKTIELAEAQEELKLLVEALKQADLRQSELLEQLAEKNAELERLAKEDALTGLYNRRYIDHLMQQAFQEAQANNDNSRYFRPRLLQKNQ